MDKNIVGVVLDQNMHEVSHIQSKLAKLVKRHNPKLGQEVLFVNKTKTRLYGLMRDSKFVASIKKYVADDALVGPKKVESFILALEHLRGRVRRAKDLELVEELLDYSLRRQELLRIAVARAKRAAKGA